MPRTPGLRQYRVTIGRTRETRGPDAFERAAAGLICAAISVAALSFAIHPIRMAQTLDAVSLATGPETDALVHLAVHGNWPAPDNRGVALRNVTGRYVSGMQAGADGAINATLSYGTLPLPGRPRETEATATHGTLSFRPVLLGARDAASITWLCGYARPPAGALADDTLNATTLPRQNLPPSCR